MTNRNATKGKSPYAKYEKAPFKYSEEYYAWAAAMNRDGIAGQTTIDADIRFRNRFGVPQYTGERSEFVE